MKRSGFLKHLLAASALPFIDPPPIALADPGNAIHASTDPAAGSDPKRRLKLSLNAYSFNEPLMKGTVSHEDLLQFCADNGFDAIDMTGYYFTGYPAPPSDDIVFAFKRKAHALGIAISGTGVRTDFTNDDPSIRSTHVKMVNEWIEVAAKLGAPVLRIFAGLQYPLPAKRPTYTKMVVDHIRECLPKAKSSGVILGIQNHHDFIRTSSEAIAILNSLNTEWAGLVLDIGSYRGEDPYTEIKRSIPYAVNWQLKENIFINNVEQPTDLVKLFKVINESTYRGYLPIETLGPGDPFKKVANFVKQVRKIMNDE